MTTPCDDLDLRWCKLLSWRLRRQRGRHQFDARSSRDGNWQSFNFSPWPTIVVCRSDTTRRTWSFRLWESARRRRKGTFSCSVQGHKSWSHITMISGMCHDTHEQSCPHLCPNAGSHFEGGRRVIHERTTRSLTKCIRSARCSSLWQCTGTPLCWSSLQHLQIELEMWLGDDYFLEAFAELVALIFTAPTHVEIRTCVFEEWEDTWLCQWGTCFCQSLLMVHVHTRRYSFGVVLHSCPWWTTFHDPLSYTERRWQYFLTLSRRLWQSPLMSIRHFTNLNIRHFTNLNHTT